ncbi:MAG: M23 family metallopeptidase [Bacteroidales bacterium]|nr:M23 family metallopeptidase [Bacteroidales bacterium]
MTNKKPNPIIRNPTAASKLKFSSKHDASFGTKLTHRSLSASGFVSQAYFQDNSETDNAGTDSGRLLLNESQRIASDNNPKRYYQKRRIRKSYAAAKRKSQKETTKTSAIAAQKASRKAADYGAKLFKYVAAHKKGALAILLIIIAALLIMTFAASFTQLALAGLGALSSGSYAPEDYVAISEADLEMTRLEANLEYEISKIEQLLPGYDRYEYNLAHITHDPFMLAAYLHATSDETAEEDQAINQQNLFQQLYTLTLSEREDAGSTSQQSISVLSIRLVQTDWNQIVESMDAGHRQAYEYNRNLLTSYRQLGSPFDFAWNNRISSRYGWRVHPIYSDLRIHRGLDISVPTGTPIQAVHAGFVSHVQHGETGYGNYVVIENAEGLRSVYAHCDTITVSIGQSVLQGKIIATAGNTGTSTGSHLHLEITMNDQYINPIFIIKQANE